MRGLLKENILSGQFPVIKPDYIRILKFHAMIIIFSKMELKIHQTEQKGHQQTNPQEPFFSEGLPNFQNPSEYSTPFHPFFQNSHLLQPFFHHVLSLEHQLAQLRGEVEQLKKNRASPRDTQTSTEIPEEASQGQRRPFPISKEFSKHIKCPIEGCRRKYSSKIAMRAHIRKNHKDFHLNWSSIRFDSFIVTFRTLRRI